MRNPKERVKVGTKVYVPSLNVKGTKLCHVLDKRTENVYGREILTVRHINKDITLTILEEKVLTLEECFHLIADSELASEVLDFKK